MSAARPQPALPATTAPPGYDQPPRLSLTAAGRLTLDLEIAARRLLAAWDDPANRRGDMIGALTSPMDELRRVARRVGA